MVDRENKHCILLDPVYALLSVILESEETKSIISFYLFDNENIERYSIPKYWINDSNIKSYTEGVSEYSEENIYIYFLGKIFMILRYCRNHSTSSIF